jgi:hypothetical protein
MTTKRKGRPKADHPKNILLRVKVDDILFRKLLICCQKKNKTRSEIIRRGIEKECGDF